MELIPIIILYINTCIYIHMLVFMQICQTCPRDHLRRETSPGQRPLFFFPSVTLSIVFVPVGETSSPRKTTVVTSLGRSLGTSSTVLILLCSIKNIMQDCLHRYIYKPLYTLILKAYVSSFDSIYSIIDQCNNSTKNSNI